MSDPGCQMEQDEVFTQHKIFQSSADTYLENLSQFLSEKWATENGERCNDGKISFSHSRTASGTTNAPSTACDPSESALNSFPELSSSEMSECDEAEIISSLRSPGSVFHPDFCARPCLFFMSGNCKSGSNCNFCHELHAKRDTHFDKRNRQLLQSASMTERLGLLLPIAKYRLAVAGPAAPLQLEEAIDAISRFIQALHRTPSQQSRKFDNHGLKSCLMSMQAKAVVTMICHTNVPEGTRDAHVLTALLGKLTECLLQRGDSAVQVGSEPHSLASFA